MVIFLGFLPITSAVSTKDAFPDVTFKIFSDFMQNHFNSSISLATALTVLFTMTSNPELLNLHARQQHPIVQGELRQTNTGWIKALALALQNKLGDDTNSLFHTSEWESSLTNNQVIDSIGVKLHNLSKVLNLHPLRVLPFMEGSFIPLSFLLIHSFMLYTTVKSFLFKK